MGEKGKDVSLRESWAACAGYVPTLRVRDGPALTLRVLGCARWSVIFEVVETG